MKTSLDEKTLPAYLTTVGNNVEAAANTCIKDERIPSSRIVFGASPNLIIEEKAEQEVLARLCFFTA